MKIAIITNRFYPEIGGSETNIYYQACELAKQYEVHIFCPRRINAPRKEKIANFTVHRLWDILNWSGFPNLKAKTLCPGLIFSLISGNFDIVQCFPSLNYNNTLSFLVTKLLRIPFIFCCFDFLDYASIIAKQNRIDPNVLYKYTPRYREKFILKRCAQIFSISDKEIKFFLQFNNNVEYSPVPILTAEYELSSIPIKPKYNLTEDNFVFLCLGRISYIKGQDIALTAFVKSLPKMPNAKLVFVGRNDYEPEYYDKIRTQVEMDNIQEHVFFTGALDRKDVLAWLRSADIHVIPVRFMNSGAVVVESWICNTPVLQSDVVDPNLVVGDYNGFLFHSEDVDDLSQKMIKAFNSRNKLRTLAEKGNILVKSKYTYDYLIEIYSKAYKRLSSK